MQGNIRLEEVLRKVWERNFEKDKRKSLKLNQEGFYNFFQEYRQEVTDETIFGDRLFENLF